MNKNRKITGYRLHKDRLLFSGGEIIRTIKYPLIPLNPTEEARQFLKKFEESVVADDLRVRGDLNLNDYLTYTSQGKISYTLFDFWKDSIRAGVIWADSAPKMVDLVAKYYSGKNELFSQIFGSINEKYKSIFDENLFISNIVVKYKEITRNNITREYFKELLKTCLKKENENSYENLIQSIVDYLFEEGEPTKDEQFRRILNYLEGNVSILEQINPSNLTFFVIPEFSIINKEENQEIEKLLERRMQIFWQKQLQNQFVESIGLAKSEIDLEKIIKKGKNIPETKFNCFSNYLNYVFEKLINNSIDELFNDIGRVYYLIEEKIEYQRKEILISLNFLSQKAKLLGRTSLPLVNGWHEYRSVFGGKLQSWFTNYQKRKVKLDEQITRFKDGLLKARDYFQNEQFPDEVQREKEDILDLLSLLENFFTDNSKSIKTEENYQVFEQLLSLVKRRLNFFYQKYIQKEGDEKKVNQFEAFKSFYEKIYKPVAFYGESARRANKKFVDQTIPILEDGVKNIGKLLSCLSISFSVLKNFENVMKDKETPEDSYRKFLQFFWNKYKEDSINSLVFKKEYEQILKENMGESEWKELQQDREKRDRYLFYKSPYAKGSLQEVKIKSDNYLERLERRVSLLLEFLHSFDKDKLMADIRIFLDWIELAKKIISLLLQFNESASYNLDGLFLDNFSRAKRYVELFGSKNYSRNEFAFVVQSLIFSEIRGAATLYSKREYTAKYSVQVMLSDNKFRLYYIPSDETIDISVEIGKVASERKELMRQPHCYALSLSKVSKKENDKNFNSIVLGKKLIGAAFLPEDEKHKLLRLSSSPYQIQFLDKYLYRPEGWENIEIALGEWSFVVEKRYNINWDLETRKPKLILKTEDRKNKIYLAIPFNLKPKSDFQKLAPLKEIVKGNEKHDKDLSRLNYPILGVDVGEYGLAYCLVKFEYDKNNYKILKAEIVKDNDEKPVLGFIDDKNIGNIKDKFSQIQQKARQGAFDEDETIVAQVRENAVGRLRNKIHFLITKKGSSVVYEDSISNFETGSGRTTKIYNSVKRADTKFESQADKQIHDHVWGNKSRWIGRNISAYASSYTCARCLRSLYQVKKEDLEKIKIEEKQGRIVTMSSPFGQIKGYLSDKKNHQLDYQFKKTDKDLKSFRKIVEDFARPPVGKNSEVLTNYAKGLLDGNKIEVFKKKRGNSAIFVCPFCQYVTDADIQAAFMMTVRGYLRFSGIVPSEGEETNKKNKKENTAGESFLAQTINYLKDVERGEIVEKLRLK